MGPPTNVFVMGWWKLKHQPLKAHVTKCEQIHSPLSCKCLLATFKFFFTFHANCIFKHMCMYFFLSSWHNLAKIINTFNKSSSRVIWHWHQIASILNKKCNFTLSFTFYNSKFPCYLLVAGILFSCLVKILIFHLRKSILETASV